MKLDNDHQLTDLPRPDYLLTNLELSEKSPHDTDLQLLAEDKENLLGNQGKQQERLLLNDLETLEKPELLSDELLLNQ